MRQGSGAAMVWMSIVANIVPNMMAKGNGARCGAATEPVPRPAFCIRLLGRVGSGDNALNPEPKQPGNEKLRLGESHRIGGRRGLVASVPGECSDGLSVVRRSLETIQHRVA